MQQNNLQYAPTGITPVVHVSQFDEGRQFRFKLYDGVMAYTMPSGTTAQIDGIKPDGRGFSYTDCISVSGNTATITTKKQMTIVPGAVKCEIRFVNGSNNIGTLNFLLMVEESPINENTDISETVLPAIFQLATEQMENAEAWANGTKNGVAVGSSEPQYHNNAKYWSEQADNIGSYWNDKTNEDGEAWTRGTRNGTAVPSTDETYHNNAKYYSEQSANSATASANSASASATSASSSASSATASANSAILSKSWAVGGTDTRSGEDTNNSKYWARQSQIEAQNASAYIAILKVLLGTVYLNTESGDNLVTESGDKILIDF